MAPLASGGDSPRAEDVRLAHEFEALVKTDDRFEITAEVILGLVCFRLKGEDATSERLLRDVNNDGRIHLVPSHMKGKFFLRLAMCGPSLQSQDIVYAWDVIKDVADHVLNSHKA